MHVITIPTYKSLQFYLHLVSAEELIVWRLFVSWKFKPEVQKSSLGDPQYYYAARVSHDSQMWWKHTTIKHTQPKSSSFQTNTRLKYLLSSRSSIFLYYLIPGNHLLTLYWCVMAPAKEGRPPSEGSKGHLNLFLSKMFHWLFNWA